MSSAELTKWYAREQFKAEQAQPAAHPVPVMGGLR
jgi:hypothetical protein